MPFGKEKSRERHFCVLASSDGFGVFPFVTAFEVPILGFVRALLHSSEKVKILTHTMLTLNLLPQKCSGGEVSSCPIS